MLRFLFSFFFCIFNANLKCNRLCIYLHMLSFCTSRFHNLINCAAPLVFVYLFFYGFIYSVCFSASYESYNPITHTVYQNTWPLYALLHKTVKYSVELGIRLRLVETIVFLLLSYNYYNSIFIITLFLGDLISHVFVEWSCLFNI